MNVFTLLLLVVSLGYLQCKCTTNNPYIFQQDGDLVLGYLIRIYEAGAQDKCSNKPRINAFAAVQSVVFAHNKSQNLLQNVSLGFSIIDTCGMPTEALARSLNFLNKNQECILGHPIPDNSTGYNKRVVGIIGPHQSTVAVPVSILMSYFETPVVSFLATSQSLSDKSKYEYFSRTVVSDTYVIGNMMSVLKSFGWTYISIVYMLNDFGYNGVREVTKLAKSKDICISRNEPISTKPSENNYTDIVKRLSKDLYLRVQSF
mgnify:CR=1 FL=1